ncbi:MAG: ECF-type sigma factor [Myxococcota bacterium]
MDITQLLARVRDGDRASLGLVFENLYEELHRIASARLYSALAPTLTPTVLIHEAFERLIGAQQLTLNDRRHFYACAARAMRMIIVDHGRRASAQKRIRDPLTLNVETGEGEALDALDLDRALDALGSINERARDLVCFRFLVGLTMQESADVLDISLRTANREWVKARAFLYARMGEYRDEQTGVRH